MISIRRSTEILQESLASFSAKAQEVKEALPELRKEMRRRVEEMQERLWALGDEKREAAEALLQAMAADEWLSHHAHRVLLALLELAQVHAVVLDENAARPDNIGQDFEKAKVRLTRKLSVDVVEKGRRWILRDAVKRSSFSMELDGSTIKVYGAAGKDERGKDVQKEAKELQKLGAEVAARRDEGQTNLDALNALLARLTEIADKHG